MLICHNSMYLYRSNVHVGELSELVCVSFVAGEQSALGLQELYCAVCRHATLQWICLCMPAF